MDENSEGGVKMEKVRKEYFKKVIQLCDEVIKDLEEELEIEDDEYVREIIKESIQVWERKKETYVRLEEGRRRSK